MRELLGYKRVVEKELNGFFDDKIRRAKLVDSSAAEMLELLKEYTLRGGKRIRAALIYFGYRCFSDKNLKEVVKASICAELIQTAVLIHDDLIDQDSLRRKGPTLHISYENIGRKNNFKGDPAHFGASMSIIAGDAGYALANEILAKINIKNRYKVKAIEKFNYILRQVIYGQGLDILSEQKEVTESDIEKIHHLKTATYTVQGPLHIGALLAGARKKHLDLLSGYALPLGKAFQLQDDILGMFGDEAKIGKPVGSDVKQGKKTLLILKALEKGSDKQKVFIKRHLGNARISKQQLEEFRKIIVDTGSLNYSKKLIKSLLDKSRNIILKAKLKPYGKKFLLDLAGFMEKREY
jgi:geranylgeranyl diphosphate synthase type I